MRRSGSSGISGVVQETEITSSHDTARRVPHVTWVETEISERPAFRAV